MAAGFLLTTLPSTRRLIAAAPASSLSIWMPHMAAENSPTADSTEKRPPTPGGTGSVYHPSRWAKSRSVPASGSVVSTIRRAKALAPSFFVSRPRAIRNCAAVSAVSPDLLITLNRVLLSCGPSRSSRLPNCTGSTLSMTNNRGPRRRRPVSRLCNGGFSAVCNAMLPRADPPMPSTTRFSAPGLNRRTAAFTAPTISRSVGRSR